MWLEQESWGETYQMAVATVLTNSEKSNSRVNKHTHHYRLTVNTIWIWTVSSWLCPDWRTCLRNIIFGSGIYSPLSFKLDLWKYWLKKSWTCYLAPGEYLWCLPLPFHHIGAALCLCSSQQLLLGIRALCDWNKIYTWEGYCVYWGGKGAWRGRTGSRRWMPAIRQQSC